MDFIDWDPPAGLDVVPSLAVMGTNAVYVKDEMYEQFSIGGKPAPVLSVASELIDRYGKLHYLDILGIRKGDVEWNLVQAISKREGELWSDTGIVYSDSVIDAIMAGANSAVISTKMINSLEEIASCLELTENIILQIDHDGSIVSKDRKIRSMSPSELVQELSAFGLSSYLIDDIDERSDTISDKLVMEVLEAVPSDTAVYAGINGIEELDHISELGLDGGIISASKLIEGLD